MKKLLLALAGLLAFTTAHADCVLKQSTASQVLQLPRFVDSTDGVTPETALTIANTDIKIGKPGGTTQTNKNSGGATHIATGDYYITLDATDTNTVGNMHIVIAPSGALPVWVDCIVVEEVVYDAQYGASALGYVANHPVNAAQIGGQTASAAGTVTFPATIASTTNITAGTITTTTNLTNLPTIPANWLTAAGIANGAIDEATYASDTNARFGFLTTGTAQAGSTGTTLVLAAAENFTADNRIAGATCAIISGTGAGESLPIATYVNSTDTATMNGTWPTTPDNTSVYACYRTAPGASGGTGLDAAATRAALGLASANLDTQLGAIDDFVDTEVAAIKTKTDFLPSATAGAAGGVFIAGTNAATTITTGLTTTFIGNQTGNVSGSVGSVTGAVGSVTGAVGSVTGAVGSVTGNVGGNVTGSVGSVATGGINAASIATDAIGAAELASDAGVELAAANLAAQGILTGTCSSGSTTTCVDAARTESNATQLQDRLMCFSDGWCAMLTTFNPGTDTATYTKTAPATRASLTYTIFPSTAQ